MTVDPARSESPPARPLERALQALLERLLALDPQSQARLAALAGRSVQLHLAQPALVVAVEVAALGKVQLRLRAAEAAAGADADLAVRTTPGALLKLLATGSAGVGQMRVEGDAEVARALEALARQYDPDVDAALSRVFGDVLGFQLARAGHGLLGWARRGALRLAEQGADYLRDDSRDLVAAAELDGFLDEVDDLRAAVDRAERRLARLEQAAGPARY